MFVDKAFTSHSGMSLSWKIECDSLTDEDWACIAKMVSNSKYRFKKVFGVPDGGLRFAKALEPYCDPTAKTILVVDDVLTTGKSIEELAKRLVDEGENGLHIRGLVLFQREEYSSWVGYSIWWEGKVASWCTAIFKLHCNFCRRFAQDIDGAS